MLTQPQLTVSKCNLHQYLGLLRIYWVYLAKWIEQRTHYIPPSEIFVSLYFKGFLFVSHIQLADFHPWMLKTELFVVSLKLKM